MKEALITVNNARKVFTSKDYRGVKHHTVALNDVSLMIYAGETLALVGESGSGKTTLGRAILGFETIDSGHITYNFNCRDHQLCQDMQIIFQDPYAALSPKMSALELVQEALWFESDQAAAKKQALEILEIVGISGDSVHKLPKQFSGGQRQRIGIARAVVSHPKFIVCDEPTSALDVSIQAQILDLLARLQQQLQLSYLFISHDLSVVRHISDRIAVMYHGHIVELADKEQLFNNPQHQYTKRLLAAAPVLDVTRAKEQLRDRQDDVIEEIVLSETFEWVEVEQGHFVRKDV